MRILIAALLVVGVSTAAGAQGAAPDLKGTWSGKFRSLVYGNNSHHPGPQASSIRLRGREISIPSFLRSLGQDGGAHCGATLV